MSNVENITSKILKDAEVERDEILVSCEEDKNKIIAAKINQAKTLESEILNKAAIEGKIKKERIVSSAKLKVRNEKLEQKQIVIDDIFNEALEELSRLSNKDTCEFIKKGILSLDIDGDEYLILNESTKKLIDKNFLKELNNELKARGNKGDIKLIDKIADFKGGFILEKNGIEINYTYESLISSLRDELEFEIARTLFE